MQVVDEAVNIADSEGKLIESQLIPIEKESVRLRNFYVNAYLGVSPSSIPKFWLVFPATVPPLGFRTYFVTKAETTGISFIIYHFLIVSNGSTCKLQTQWSICYEFRVKIYYIQTAFCMQQWKRFSGNWAWKY